MPDITSDSASKTHARLKERHREIRDNQEYNLKIRVHRSLSWLERAEECTDPDGKLIFLWIAFNAAYAKDSGPDQYNKRNNERKVYKNFFKKLCRLDRKNQINNLIREEFDNNIQALLDNEYISYDFWEYQRGNISENEWKSYFYGDNQRAEYLKSRSNTWSTTETLSIVFSRIYMLRNQLVHGGATWGGGINREQIGDCVQFMEKFVTAMLEILIEEKECELDPVPYPVMNKEK